MPPRGKDRQKRKPRADGNRPAWSKSPIIADQNPDLPEGYNTKMIQFMMEIAPTEKLDVWDVPEMERRFKRYLQMCAERDVKVGNQAAYFAIGITKETARDWVKQDVHERNERTHFIKRVQQICAMYREGLMQDGKVNPVTGIFWQKNYDGLKDQTETVITPNNPLGDTIDSDTLRRRYLEQKEPPLIAESAERDLLKIENQVPEVAEREFSEVRDADVKNPDPENL